MDERRGDLSLAWGEAFGGEDRLGRIHDLESVRFLFPCPPFGYTHRVGPLLVNGIH